MMIIRYKNNIFSKEKCTKSLLCLILLLLYGCDLIEYHPYDALIHGQTNINEKNIERIVQKTSGADTIRFALISDTQRWYDETEDEVQSINQRNDIDFVIHCGDISDFGVTKEFMWQRDILNGLDVPYVVLLGNHDCLGDGEEVFYTIFGEENFSFTAGHVRFICLNTNALEYDYSNPVPDLTYIENEINHVPSDVQTTVVAMHAKPYSEQFNNNVAKPFQYYLHMLKNPLFCICGHGHSTKVNDLFNDGLLYYEITCAKYRQYYIFTIQGTEYSYETVDY